MNERTYCLEKVAQNTHILCIDRMSIRMYSHVYLNYVHEIICLTIYNFGEVHFLDTASN